MENINLFANGDGVLWQHSFMQKLNKPEVLKFSSELKWVILPQKSIVKVTGKFENPKRVYNLTITFGDEIHVCLESIEWGNAITFENSEVVAEPLFCNVQTSTSYSLMNWALVIRNKTNPQIFEPTNFNPGQSPHISYWALEKSENQKTKEARSTHDIFLTFLDSDVKDSIEKSDARENKSTWNFANIRLQINLIEQRSGEKNTSNWIMDTMIREQWFTNFKRENKLRTETDYKKISPHTHYHLLPKWGVKNK